MTKAYEKDICFFLNWEASFHETSPPPNIAVNDTNKNLESNSNKICHSREQTRNAQTGYRKVEIISIRNKSKSSEILISF